MDENNLRTRPGPGSDHRTMTTRQWLIQNYESSEGFSLPRCLIYEHYLDFCQKNHQEPVNAASFGKVIRQVFVQLKTRRLGTRGQSKYHYYGIKVKSDSPYYNTMVTAQRMSHPCHAGAPGPYRSFSPIPLFTAGRGREGGGEGKTGTGAGSSGGNGDGGCVSQGGGGIEIIQVRKQSNVNITPVKTRYTPETATHQLTKPFETGPGNSLLPAFPTSSHLVNLPSTVDQDEMNDLLRDYRIYANIILEVILRGGLDEVECHMASFWSNLPVVQQRLVQNARICEALAVCDTYLYHTLVSILIPGTLNYVPSSLLQDIRQFSCGFPAVVQSTLASCPKQVLQNKMPAATRFSQLLKRKTSLAHLSQATRSALAADVTISQMQLDWERRTEHDTVCSQLVWAMPQLRGVSHREIRTQMDKFQKLLESRATVEEHIKWVEDVRSSFAEKGNSRESRNYEKGENAFLMGWCYVCSLIIRDQTLRSATSFGSFHLLNLLYQEYLLYVMEVHRHQRQETVLWHRVMGDNTPMSDGFLLPDVDPDDDEVDDLQNLPTTPMSTRAAHDDFFDPDTPRGSVPLTATDELQLGLSGDVTAADSASLFDLLERGPAVKQSDIIPLAFAASSPAGVTASTGEMTDFNLGVSAAVSDRGMREKTDPTFSTRTTLSSLLDANISKPGFEVSATVPSAANRAQSFVSTKMVRATLLTSAPGQTPSTDRSEPGKPGGDSSGEVASPSVIALDVPEIPGLNLHKGQFLTAGDGKKYIINDVQTVLRPAGTEKRPEVEPPSAEEPKYLNL